MSSWQLTINAKTGKFISVKLRTLFAIIVLIWGIRKAIGLLTYLIRRVKSNKIARKMLEDRNAKRFRFDSVN